MTQYKPELSINEKEHIFVEKYRPKTIDDIVLPEHMKKKLREWKADGQIPNLLLVSKAAGLGKTSLAHVIANELQAEVLFINASLHSNIDTLRDKIQSFVTTVSFDNRPKIVVLDEADGLSANKFQPALRAFIEEFSKNARFILTANQKNKLIEPLRNRLIDYNFDNEFSENKELIKDIYLRCQKILTTENIKFEQKDLLNIVKHYYPSQRSIIMKIDAFTVNGTLVFDSDAMDIDDSLKQIRQLIKDSHFETLRQVLANLTDPSLLIVDLYNNLDEFPIMKRPLIAICIAKYQMADDQVRDRVVNIAAMCAEIQIILNS